MYSKCILFLLLICTSLLNSQTILELADVTALPSKEVVVSLSVKNFNKIGAFTIRINYNSDNLTYLALENWHALVSSEVQVNSDPGTITFAWAKASGASLGDGKLVDLRWIYKGGAAAINFDQTYCEIADNMGNVITADFINGSISTAEDPLLPPVLNSPENNSEGQPVSLALVWNPGAGALTYNLQVSKNENFSSNEINLTGIIGTTRVLTGLSKNTKFYWRVAAANNTGTSDWSSAWNFTTISPQPSSYHVSASNYDPAVNSSITITAQLLDEDNKPLSLSGRIVTWSSTNGGTFSSPASTTDNTGKAEINFITGSIAGTVHKITATDQGSVTGTSNDIIAGLIDPPILSTPLDKSTGLGTEVYFTWQPVALADYYLLEISSGNSFVNPEFSYIVNASLKYVNSLSFNTEYYWRVKAFKGTSGSEWSPVWKFTTIDFINSPSELFAEAPQVNKIVLSWQDNSNNETGFKIEKSKIDDPGFTLLNTIAGGITEYEDSNVQENTVYIYRIKAFNNETESGFSNEFQIRTPVSGIEAPSNFTYKPNSAGQFMLSWQDNSNNEDGFCIERSSNSGGLLPSKSNLPEIKGLLNYVHIATLPPNSTQYLDLNVSEQSSYSYRVYSFGTAGISVADKDETQPNAIPLKAPTGLTGYLLSTTLLKLCWQDNSNAEDNYVIEAKYDTEFVEVAQLQVNDSTYEMNIDPEQKTIYRIYAKANSSRSEYSNEFTLLPVPVELVSFRASYTDYKVLLEWRTITEQNNNGFEVQKIEGDSSHSWETIGFVKGAGTSTIINNYSYTDALKNVTAGINFLKYRLKQIDFDGSSHVSEPVKVEVDLTPASYQLLQNYPNPFNPSTHIDFKLPENGHISLIIYNILGDNIATLIDEVKPAGVYSIEFNAENLAAGIYFYELKTQNFRSVKKCLLLK